MYIAAIHMLFWLFGFFGRVLWHIVFWFWSFFVSWKCKQQLHLQIIILVVKNITLVDVYDKHIRSLFGMHFYLVILVVKNMNSGHVYGMQYLAYFHSWDAFFVNTILNLAQKLTLNLSRIY